MSRQSISFTKNNDDWLNAQVQNQEYASKSEAVNDLIRQARRKQEEIEWVRAKLKEGEKSGFIEVTEENHDKIFADIKARARQNAKL